jgi:hypothetical protein
LRHARAHDHEPGAGAGFEVGLDARQRVEPGRVRSPDARCPIPAAATSLSASPSVPVRRSRRSPGPPSSRPPPDPDPRTQRTALLAVAHLEQATAASAALRSCMGASRGLEERRRKWRRGLGRVEVEQHARSSTAPRTRAGSRRSTVRTPSGRSS